MDKIKKRLYISFLIMILVLTGCTNTSGDKEADDQAGTSSSAYEEADDNVPEEGTTASECDWSEVEFNGISFWVPSEWELDDSLGEDILLYEDTISPDFVRFKYKVDTDISKEQRVDPALFEDAIMAYDYIWIGATRGEAVMLGSRLCYKVFGTYYQDKIAYQGHIYYIPVGDYGIVEAMFMHAKEVDDPSDGSCLEMMISSLKTDDSSLPEDSKDLGMTDLGNLPVTLVNDEGFVIRANSVTGGVVNISIINKSDEERRVSLEDLSINGYMVDGEFDYEEDGYDFSGKSCSVEAGKEMNAELTASDLDAYGITDIGRVGIKFRCLDSDYDEFFDSDYILFNADPGYDEDDYASYKLPDVIVYEDENVIIYYEGITDNSAYFSIKNLQNEIVEVSGSKVSLDGEFCESSSLAGAYPGTIDRMQIKKVQVSPGMQMVISFSISLNNSHYSTDNCSVNL